MASTSSQTINPDFQPRTAILLCLRGPDPSIKHCLRALAAQTFTNFELHLVTDCAEDPVIGIAEEVLRSLSNDQAKGDEEPSPGKHEPIAYHFHVLPTPIPTCGLKNSALIHAISQLPDDVSVVASLDADAVVSPNWLATLIAPLENPKVGISTGNRWFRIPTNQKIGSAVRAVWNAAAVVQMYLYQIPWGGSLAIRRDVINKGGMLDKWSNAFCEDTLLAHAVKELGLVVARPVEVVVVNEESTSCYSAFRWIRRQLLTVRLHHSRWPLVMLHGLSVGLPLVCLLVIVWDLFVGSSGQAATNLLAGLFLFELFNLGLLIGIHQTHKILLRRAGDKESSHTNELYWYAMALPLTQAIHFAATISAVLARKVSWRQIEYRIGKSKIELIEYRPFVSGAEQGVEQHSID